MDRSVDKLNTIYETRKYKSLYTFILSGLTTFLLIVLPFFVSRKEIISTIWIDLLIRVFITYNFCMAFYFVSHLDQYYEKFYKGARTPIFSTPDTLKQIVNILGAIFVGIGGFLFLKLSTSFFIPNIEIAGTIISIFIGIMLFTPLLSQYKKR